MYVIERPQGLRGRRLEEGAMHDDDSHEEVEAEEHEKTDPRLSRCVLHTRRRLGRAGF